jgi:hypothetical protein
LRELGRGARSEDRRLQSESARGLRSPTWLTPTPPRSPTRSGVNVRTRKRNIVVPSDPGSFADAILSIFQVSVCSFLEGALLRTLQPAMYTQV